MNNKKLDEIIKEYVLITIGCVLYAIAFDWFYMPNNLTCGGLTGVAQILHFLFPVLPVGALLLVMNVPLYILGFRRFGFRFLVKSLYAMALSSVLVDVVASIYTFHAMDELLACLYGGVLLGVGCGIINHEESNTGGTELLAWILKHRLPQLSFGNVMLGLDLVVILCYAAAFQNLDNALYGGIALFVSAKVVDLFIYGANTGKLAHVISARQDEITDALLAEGVGVTKLRAIGAYTQTERPILLCAVRRREIVMVKRIVKEIDPDAFFIVSDTSEVLGEGFGEYNPNGL
ncbi:MAG: YitT family protein [Oscillospiraceae bacterium]|nr:YitT family protein [Oscillospiraceae bacterium]